MVENEEVAIRRWCRNVEVNLELSYFNQPDLLRQALTHSSYVREVRRDLEDNELFETKGDGFLSESFARFLKEFPTRLNRRALSGVALSNVFIGTWAMRKGILNCALFGPHFKRNLLAIPEGGSARLVAADLFEALVWAVNLDQGFDAAHEFATDVLWSRLAGIGPEHLRVCDSDGKQEMPIVEDDGSVRFVPGLSGIAKRLTRIGYPNAETWVAIKVTLPDGSICRAQNAVFDQAVNGLRAALREHLTSEK